MRKKLKAREWSLVYQHVRPRLQYEGGKTFRIPTAILINGTKKSWDACWKEFRRNQVLGQGPHQGLCNEGLQKSVSLPANMNYTGPLPPLPPGILVRTPSPELIESNLLSQQPKSSYTILLHLFQTTIVSLQPLFAVQSQSEIESNEALKYPDSVYRLCLEGVPFTRLFDRLSGII